MQFYGVLVLMVALSTACGIRCYVCDNDNPCQKIDCPLPADRCASVMVNGIMAKSCFVSSACESPIECCEGDLCNGAITTGSSVLLLLVSSAIFTVFL